jgi:hypothetical protein
LAGLSQEWRAGARRLKTAATKSTKSPYGDWLVQLESAQYAVTLRANAHTQSYQYGRARSASGGLTIALF